MGSLMESVVQVGHKVKCRGEMSDYPGQGRS
jgi:hypothetical protein